MARTEHHSAYAFLSYYLIYFLWKGSLMPGLIVFLIVFFGLFPDLDGFYWKIKEKQKMDTKFQHHLYYWTHWPISYIPLILIFIVCVIFNFYPELFLIPVIGIYCGHLIPDSISTGDGIMWGKLPWKKTRYARYTNLFSSKTDGYHGGFWSARYRKTIFFKIGNSAVISCIIIIILFQINAKISIGYIVSFLYFIIGFVKGLKKIPEQFYKEPPEGRYADYRTNPKYINGLSKKNRKLHLKKYAALLEKK